MLGAGDAHLNEKSHTSPPSGRNASSTALISTGSIPTVPASPAPFTASRWTR